MQLIIVESPTKARTLKKYLGSAYLVESSVGHIRDLPKSKLGVDVDSDFEPVYEVVKGKGVTILKLKKLAKTAESVILATDPDREGEAIGWHVAELLGKSNKNMRRVTFHEITKSAIMEAMGKPSEINMALVDAQQARRVLDRLVGYKLSPVLWKKVRRGLSAGRVQSVALRLMVEREREIEAYVPQAYWEIKVEVGDGKNGNFWTDLVRVGNKKVVVMDPKQKALTKKELEASFRIDTKKVADEIVADLDKALYKVLSVERKERKRQPYPPFTTSTLQQAAASRFGWSGKMTMQVAQRLYEAGHITYHRTDSLALSEQAIEAARKYVLTQFGKTYLHDKPRRYKTKSKSAQEAHEAIRPTQVDSGGNIAGLEERQAKLYRLIWQRMLATQMAAAVYDQTSVEVEARVNKQLTTNNKQLSTHLIYGQANNKQLDYGLRATGSIVKFDGWMKLAQLSTNNKQQTAKNTRDDDVTLPDLVEGQELDKTEVVSEGKETQPLPRYNDASLIKELEKRGIGRPSTYASIIGVLDDRGYVERRDRRFYPTPVGMTVVDFLTKYFATVMDYEFTAGMEEDLDRIARGEKKWRVVMRDFWEPFAKTLAKVEDKAERMSVPVEETGKKCPKCDDGEVVIRTGRFGKFYSCSNFGDKEKGCDYAENIVVKVEGVVCPLCRKGDVVSKNTRWGKPFFGCSLYPDCNWASWKQPQPGETLTMEEWKVMQEKREARKKVWAERMAKRKNK